MKIAVRDLKDRNLDLAAAISLDYHTQENFTEYEGIPSFSKEFEPDEPANKHCLKTFKNYTFYQPTRNWEQGGKIIDMIPNLCVRKIRLSYVASTTSQDGTILHTGETFLEACVKVFVEYKLNTEYLVLPEIPNETPEDAT